MLKLFLSTTICLIVLVISQISVIQADWKDDMLESVNAERQLLGLDPLCYNKKLTVAAENHAYDMIANDFFAHTGSDGSLPWDRMENEGYSYISASENIAYGQTSVNEVMNDWMNTPYNRDNILSENVHFGASWKEPYWVQTFATPWSSSFSEVCDPPSKLATCRDAGWYYLLKNEFCKVRANKTSAKFARYYEVIDGTNEEVLATECETSTCLLGDCCVKGRKRKCSNTGKKGQEGQFTQGMCGPRRTLKPFDQLDKTPCTGQDGYKCTRKNCCIMN